MSRKGENIYKRKDGRWEASIAFGSCGKKTRYLYVYGRTYAEARAKKADALSRPENVRAPVSKRAASVGEAAEEWLSYAKDRVKESTYARYRRAADKVILPAVGNKTISSIDTDDISRFLAGGVPQTAGDVWRALWRYAKKRGYPCCDFPETKKERPKIRSAKIIPDESRRAVEDTLMRSDDLTSLGIFFTLFTGVRIGELCGIRWDDIDLDGGSVTVRRTIERIPDVSAASGRKTKVIVGTPKTGSSARTIPLPRFLTEYLRTKSRSGEDYLITGKPKFTEPHSCYVRYRRFLEKNGIERYTFHTLRHTFATGCIDAGFDVKSLSEILGHSSVATTMAYYVHPTMQMKKRQMDMLLPIAERGRA